MLSSMVNIRLPLTMEFTPTAQRASTLRLLDGVFFFYLLCFFLSLFRELMDHSGPPKSIQCSEDRRPRPGQPTSFLRERDSCRILLMGVMRSQPTWECTTCCIEHGHVGQLGFRVFCCRCRCCYCFANLNPGERTLALSHICHEVVLSHQDH